MLKAPARFPLPANPSQRPETARPAAVQKLARDLTARPLTPKEMSAAVGGARSEKWFRAQCRTYLRTKGKHGIRTVTPAPYLIPAAELERFCA